MLRFAGGDGRERGLRLAMLVITVLGVALAGYLTVIHYADIKPLCAASSHGTSTCLKVQTSVYSKLAGIPVALLGLISYVVILGMLVAPVSELTRAGLVSITLGGFGFSAYLTYREVFTLKEICEECVTSAVFLTILLVLAVIRYLRGDAPAPAPSEPVALEGRTTPRARVAASE